MWADEPEPDWGADTPEPAPAQPAAVAAEGAKKEGDAPAAEGAPAEGAPVDDPDDITNRKFNRHWVRPKFLQYSYMYDYRKNYYDDVIDWMDRRTHGINREIPRPQTWAERALRTYNQRLGPSAGAIKTKTDAQLIHSLHHVKAIHDFHSKSYYHKVFTIAY